MLVSAYSKANQLYVYTYPIFFGLFSHLGHDRALSRVTCAVWLFSLVIYSIHRCVKGTLPSSFYEATIALLPKPDKDITQKRKLQTNITDEHRHKNNSVFIHDKNSPESGQEETSLDIIKIIYDKQALFSVVKTWNHFL